MKKSRRSKVRSSVEDDEYDVTYNDPESAEVVVERLDTMARETSDVKMRLKSQSTIMKCGFVTNIILVVITVSLLAAVLANSNTKATSEDIDTAGPESLNLTSVLKSDCYLSNEWRGE